MPQLVMYPTVVKRSKQLTAFRFGRLVPGLFDSVMHMRQQESLKLKRKHDENPIPHIRNALQQVPSENLGQQKIIQDRMRVALDDMHRQIVDDIAKYIDNRVADVDWLSSPVNIDYIASDIAERLVAQDQHEVRAYEKSNLLALIKLLTFFALSINSKNVPPQLVSKVAGWYNEATPLFEEIKLAKRNYKVFDPRGLKPGKLRPNQEELLRAAMKTGRKALRDKAVQKRLGASPVYRSQYVRLLSNLFSYFNSDSARAYDFMVNNIGILDDADLNSLLSPKFSGDSSEEAKKLAKLVVKHGGSGHALTPQLEDKLRERNAAGHQDYRKQYNLVRNATKLELRRLVRASGQKFMDASKIKAELVKLRLPTDFIPAGFERGGKYDEAGNMFNASGVQFSVNPVGGWLRWKSGSGKDEEAIAEYQNPRMAQPAIIQSMWHVKVGLQQGKRSDVEHNENHIDKFKRRWVTDTESSNPTTKMLGHLAQILYYTGIRVGGGSTDGKPTYGLTKLLAGHVKRYTDADGETGVILDFVGKSGIQHKLRIAPNDNIRRRLIAYILKQATGKPRKSPLWTIGTRTRPISSGTLNKYLQAHGWAGSAKTFRTVRGNMVFKRELQDEPTRFNSRQNAIKYIEDKIRKVGEELGHKRTNKEGKTENTFQTAAKAYIDPHLIIEFFNRHGVNPKPAWAERLEHEHSEENDSENEDD